MAATSEIKVTGLEDLESASRARTEERRREVALECAARSLPNTSRWTNDVHATAIISRAKRFEAYLRGE